MHWRIHRFFRAMLVAMAVMALVYAGVPNQPAVFAQDSVKADASGESVAEVTSSGSGSSNEQPELQKSQAISHYWLASSYFKQWKLELAGVELEEALAFWPDLQAAHKDLCLVDVLTGHPLRALAQLMMLVGLGDPIPLAAAQQTDLKERAVKLHYKQGIKSGAERNWTEAVTEFQWALSYKPEDANIYRSLAFAYANSGNLDKAEQFYQTTFKMSPTDAFAHADFAFMLSDNGKKQQAEQQLSQAVKLEPAAAALHVDLGWVAESGGDFATAEKEFRAAVDLSPKHGGLWAHLGRILEHEGKDSEAMDAYNQAIEIDPGQDDARQSLAKLKGST